MRDQLQGGRGRAVSLAPRAALAVSVPFSEATQGSAVESSVRKCARTVP